MSRRRKTIRCSGVILTLELLSSMNFVNWHHISYCYGLLEPMTTTRRRPFIADHSFYSFELTCTTTNTSTDDGKDDIHIASNNNHNALLSAIDTAEPSYLLDDHRMDTPKKLPEQPPLCESQPPSPSSLSPSWKDRLDELVQFKTVHGHTRVPKRYSGGLGVWVDHQRQRKDRIDIEWIHILDSIGFCWDASMDKSDKERQQWWKRFQDLQQHKHTIEQVDHSVSSSSSSVLLESLSASQSEWLRRQRNEYIEYYILQYSTTCKLDEAQIQALNGLDPSWWKTSRERQWDTRCQELVEYRKKHGKVVLSLSVCVFVCLFVCVCVHTPATEEEVVDVGLHLDRTHFSPVEM